MNAACTWQREPKKGFGVLCGCDGQQEWLLPWWWERYRAANDFPVTFVDFGMSAQARAWCKAHGELVLLHVSGSFITAKEKLSSANVRSWEAFYGPTLWQARLSFFKKPFALLHAGYERTVWIDLDCEILASLQELSQVGDPSRQLALVREHATTHLPKFHSDARYNGGVIVFVHGAHIIQQWAEAALERNGDFWSDDSLLSALIAEQRVNVLELSSDYNWRLAQGINMNAIIHHWVGSAGKAYIKHYGGIKERLSMR